MQLVGEPPLVPSSMKILCNLFNDLLAVISSEHTEYIYICTVVCLTKTASPVKSTWGLKCTRNQGELAVFSPDSNWPFAGSLGRTLCCSWFLSEA